MRYPVALIPDDERGGFTVILPDLPGCITEGDSRREALEMAKDAASGWIDVAIETGVPVNSPSPIEHHLAADPDEYREAVWAFIEIETPAVA